MAFMKFLESRPEGGVTGEFSCASGWGGVSSSVSSGCLLSRAAMSCSTDGGYSVSELGRILCLVPSGSESPPAVPRAASDRFPAYFQGVGGAGFGVEQISKDPLGQGEVVLPQLEQRRRKMV